MNEWYDNIEARGYNVITFAALRDRPFRSTPYLFELRVEFDRIDEERDCIHFYDFKIDCRQQPYSMDYQYTPSVKHPDDALFFSDLIDFLRRNGVKVYNSPFEFKSLTPKYMLP